MPQLPRVHRVTGNRFNRRGDVVPDRRAYYDWADDYEPGYPLRPPAKISPAKADYRTVRRQRRTLAA